MTVYVDNFRVPARVGRISARWSHLTADTPEELHEFAQRLGMKRGWFQGRCKNGNCPTVNNICTHYHYDVVDSRRTEAIALGAQPITLREMGGITSGRRDRFRAGQVDTSPRCLGSASILPGSDAATCGVKDPHRAHPTSEPAGTSPGYRSMPQPLPIRPEVRP